MKLGDGMGEGAGPRTGGINTTVTHNTNVYGIAEQEHSDVCRGDWDT